MERFTLREEDYKSQMDDFVCPFLKQRQKIVWLEREKGKKLYCVHYRADNPRGIILIAHGFTETAEKYAECIYYFLQMGLHAFCVEHCGHGHSYRLVDDSSLVFADRFDRYVDDFIFTARFSRMMYPDLPLFLYAHSMGGGIAAAAAAREPGLFNKAILSSPMIQPDTGAVPWAAAKAIAGFMCFIGMEKRYAAGQKPYHGPEQFEESACTSRARFDYYQKKRHADPLYQMSAISYGWLMCAVKLKKYLMKKGWKQLKMPLLVFQAQDEKFVSNFQMDRFTEKVRRNGNIRQIKVEGAKHEIYNSYGEVLENYWESIRNFI